MSLGSGVVKNSISIIMGNFLVKGISVLLLFYLANYLSPAEFGDYSFVVAYITFCGIFTDLGLNILFTREISAGRLDKNSGMGYAVILRLALTVVTLSSSITALYLFGYPAETVKLAAAFSLSLLVSFRGLFFRNVFEVPFQVSLKMNYPAVINFLNEVVTLGAVVWLISIGAGLLTLVAAIALVNLPGFVAMVFFSTRLIKPSFRFDARAWAGIMRSALPLGAVVVLEGVFIFIPVFLLSRLSTSAEVGFYSLSFRLVSSIWIIPVAVMVSLQPAMSRSAAKGEGLEEGFFTSLKWMLLMGIPMAVLTVFLAEPLLAVFTNGKFTEAASALSVMVWGTLMYFVNSVFFYTFTAAGEQHSAMIAWAVMILIAALASWLLIPSMGHMGAAVAYVAATSGGALTYLVMAHRKLKLNVLGFLMRPFSMLLQGSYKA